jgi:hypothetical protein
MLVIPRKRIVTNRVTEVTYDARRPPRAKGGGAHASSIPEFYALPCPLHYAYVRRHRVRMSWCVQTETRESRPARFMRA